MHSCELAAPPPAQGAALLLELGTLIIESRTSKGSIESGRVRQADSSVNAGAERPVAENEENQDVEGVLSKRTRSSPVKRNRDRVEDENPEKVGLPEGPSVYDLKARLAKAAPLRGRAEALWRDHTPLCIEVLLAPACGVCREPLLLLERWTMSVYSQRNRSGGASITSQWLLNAVRSQLHFSQISAWSAKLKEEAQERRAKLKRELSPSERQRKLSRETCNYKKYESNCDEDVLKADMERGSPDKESSFKLENLNVVYDLRVPQPENYKTISFQHQPSKHAFPLTDIGGDAFLEVLLESLPRLDDVPVVHCGCSAGKSETPKRRKSKDCSSECTRSDDVLAKKMAIACTLVETAETSQIKDRSARSNFSPELNAVNSDMGCSSTITRKFPIYSTEFGFRPLSPDRSELDDSGFCSKSGVSKTSDGSSPESSADGSIHENSYCLQYGNVPNIQVPSENYLVVDDRMMTPCLQNGKHRCNCDDESDQGVKDSTKNNVVSFCERNLGNSPESFGDFYKGVQNNKKRTVEDKKPRDSSKHVRKHRKESKQRQLLDVKESSLCNGPSRKLDLINRKTRTCSSSDNSDGRSSPELVRYGSLCHNCRNCACESRVFDNPAKYSKQPESSVTTSIPILQASKFDHVNRFRSTKSLHGPLARRDFYSLKQQQSIVSSLKYDCANREIAPSESDSSEKCCTKSFNCDDDYRPSTKKLISSYTQTDDVLCECGKSLVPMCSDCSQVSYSSSVSKTYCANPNSSALDKIAMKRSKANHNLAQVNKSALLLDAIERTSRKTEKRSCEDESHNLDLEKDSNNRLVASCGKKVIDFHCDNSISKINNCECDNNIIYSNSYKKLSCTKDSLTYRKSLFRCNDKNENKINSYSGKENSLTESDLSILMSSNSTERIVKYPDSNVCEDDALESFIRKPKLKRFATPMDRIDKIIHDRNLKKMKDKCFEKNHTSVNSNIDSFYQNDKDEIHASDKYITTPNRSHQIQSISNEDDSVVIYEKGDYGIFGHMKEGDKIKSMPITCTKNVQQSSVTPGSEHSAVPSVSEMDKFRWRLDSAASMVFHSHTGLPLTSSPAPLRRGKSCFDYDSSINSVSSIKSALYGLSSTDLETIDQNPTWSPGSSPGSPSHIQMEPSSFNYNALPKTTTSAIVTPNRRNKFRHGTSSGLLGSFEESVLNGRLEPAATVAGFTAEIGASGEFCPPHITLPVTVFFYTLGDNTTSSPYLGHINLGRKGYCVPRAGTIQVTLFNPHGTVVKMFVVMYDLEDMPPYSRTFLRQRTLWGKTCLRYLIHLRFLTSKSGKVYLHTDIRIIVSRKADIDTAAAHSLNSGLRINLKGEKDSDAGKKKGCKIEQGTFERRSRKDQFIMEKQKLNDINHNGFVGQEDCVKVKKQMSPVENVSMVISKELSYELRSYTYGPDNPKYSPR